MEVKRGGGDSSLMLARNPLVQLQAVDFAYPPITTSSLVLAGINLEVHSGDVVQVTGRNGAGKSTLLRLLAGELEPSSGVRRVSHELEAVYLDQNASNFTAPDLTVLEQLLVSRTGESLVFLRNQRNSADEIRRKLGAFDVGLEDRLDSFVAQLSGGQRQIVALLSVLVSGAQLLCLDEFTSAMDEKSIAVSDGILEGAIHSKGVGLVYAKHLDHLRLSNRRIHLSGKTIAWETKGDRTR